MTASQCAAHDAYEELSIEEQIKINDEMWAKMEEKAGVNIRKHQQSYKKYYD